MSFRTLLTRHRAAAGFAGGVMTTAVLGSGVAFASVPSSATGSITACVNRSSAAVRIIDFQAGKRCTSRERTVLWSKGYRYRGGWSPRSTYAVLDVVSYGGSSYLARVASTGRTPASGPYWGLLAVRGAAGPRGTTGARGFTGPMGPSGMNGADGLDGVDGADGLDGIQGPMGEQGPPGEDGAPGPQGPAGPAGPAGVLGYQVVTKQYLVPSGATTQANTACPTGKIPVGGGGYVGNVYAGHGSAAAAYISESVLNSDGTGWLTTLVVVAPTDATTFTVKVICVTAGS